MCILLNSQLISMENLPFHSLLRDLNHWKPRVLLMHLRNSVAFLCIFQLQIHIQKSRTACHFKVMSPGYFNLMKALSWASVHSFLAKSHTLCESAGLLLWVIWNFQKHKKCLSNKNQHKNSNFLHIILFLLCGEMMAYVTSLHPKG